MKSGITIVIPSIPPRKELLSRALSSVFLQTHSVDAISISFDKNHQGSWHTRNSAISMVETEWLGFLDDDDELLPHHVEFLLNKQEETGADMLWGWFNVIGGTDPFPTYRGRQYNIEVPHIVPITYIVRTSLIKEAIHTMGGFQPDTSKVGAWDIQDMPLINQLVKLGAKTHADNEITWKWHHHKDNTSGLPTRW